jgi:sec-independent protein translocase protein TatB
MLGMGPQEILIILAVALIFIGPKRLPEIARTLGKGFAELRKAADDLKGQIDYDNLMKDKEDDRQPESTPRKDFQMPCDETRETETSTTAESEGMSPADERQKKTDTEKVEG